MLSRNRCGLELDIPPGHINGRLKTAPIVALFLNPGIKDDDRAHFATSNGRQQLIEQAEGESDFPLSIPGWKKWFLPRVRIDGMEPHELAKNVAIFNVCAYASREASLLTEAFLRDLPSANIARAYLRQVLIPEARARRRFIVICRGRRFWGVDRSECVGNIQCGFPRGGHFGPAVREAISRWRHET
jgi:hypothetical protein